MSFADLYSEYEPTMKLRLIPALIMAMSLPLVAQADGLAFGQARALMQERAEILKCRPPISSAKSIKSKMPMP